MRRVPLPTALSQNVKDVFALLLKVNEAQNVNAVLRVAGGWVRDQMLNVESNDIDIAIETPADIVEQRGGFVTGAAFAQEIKNYSDANGLPSRTMSVIKVNPEKSKHIETAQLTVLGLPLEFCHLRTDEYTADSRVPVVRPGSPTEDALRRDFTVNALFYNLHTGDVEDFTGTGIADMEEKRLRTPLEPRVTFLDDPLRLLRGIRFSGQLGYSLDESVISAARDDSVLAALTEKVTRERIGIEMNKMLRGNDPVRCIHYLGQLGLLQHSVFYEYYMKKGKKAIDVDRVVKALPADADAEQKTMDEIEFLACNCYDQLASTESIIFPKGDERRAISTFFMILPIYGAVPVIERIESVPAMCTNALKLPGSLADQVNKMITGYQSLLPEISNIVSIATENAVDGPATAEGNEPMFFQGAAREAIYGALQQVRMLPACALPAIIGAAAATVVNVTDNNAPVDGELGRIVNNILQAIARDSGGRLAGSASRGAVIKGEQLAKSLGVEKKLTGHFLQAQMRFLLHNPDAGEEQVLEYLKSVPPPQ